ncbi:hypothetical protein HMPREF0491_01853 [Lachnospiraceae oral taxon 107 str. F0167]|nr:hypothetical protein HMPREF0491_01853 [Lachnospiraceae oral taxon 107 str. F0167]
MSYTITFYLGIFIIILLFLMEGIAFFKDEEFLRAVRDTMGKDRMSLAKRREKPIKGIIWKRSLRKMNFLSINFKDYHVKDITDLQHFKNVETIILTYMGDNEEDIGIYEEEKILENVHYLKSLKKLRRIQLYHLKINSDVKAICPNARVFID